MARHSLPIAVKDEHMALQEEVIRLVNLYRPNHKGMTQIEALAILVRKGYEATTKEK